MGCLPERTQVNLLGIFDSVMPMEEAAALPGVGVDGVESEAAHEFVNGDKCGAQGLPRHTTVMYACLAGAGGPDDRIETIHEVRPSTA